MTGLTAVEYLMKDVFDENFDALRDRPDLVDYAIRTANARTLKNTKTLVKKKTKLPIYLGYPFDTFKVPCIVIELDRETESDQFIGQSVGDYVIPQKHPPFFVEDEPLSFPSFQLLNIPLVGARIYRDGELVPEDRYFLNFYTGKGRLFDDYGNFTANYEYIDEYVDIPGTLFNTTLSFSILSNNQEETISLYRIIQFILLSNRIFLAGIGLKNQMLGGSDLEPFESSRHPEPMFRRVVHFSFEIEGGGYIPLPVLREITINPSTY